MTHTDWIQNLCASARVPRRMLRGRVTGMICSCAGRRDGRALRVQGPWRRAAQDLQGLARGGERGHRTHSGWESE
eukprot:8079823-Alexandrium_andersonii.AAC.1